MTTMNDHDHDLSSPIPIPPAPPSPAESDLDSLSWGSSSSSPSSPPALHALSLSSRSTTATSPSLARKESNLSSWSDGEKEGGQRGMAVSAPVTPLQLPRGREEGRKRSLTDVLKIEGEEERGRVALELSRWINASPSPFESDSSRTPLSTPIPRPLFPLFRPSGISQSLGIATPRSVSDALGLYHRGLPVERKMESKGKVSTCGFIPFVPIPSVSSGNLGDEKVETKGEMETKGKMEDEVQGS